jgi:hypothetical protein
MDIKDLIKAIDTDGILDKETVAELVTKAEQSICEKVAAAKEEGKAEGKKEAANEAEMKIQEAEKTGYKKGVEVTLTETESVIKEAEKSGFDAGVKVALEEAEALANKYDEEIKEAIRELAEAYDTHVENNTACKIKETEDALTEKVVESLDNYLNTYIKEVIPESVVIDYDRIQKLEKTFQVLKESLMVTDPMVEAKVKELNESVNKELTKAQVALKTEVQNRIIVENKMNEQEARILLTEKISDLPAYEKKLLKTKFTGSTVKEINESFDDVLAKIKETLIAEDQKSKVTETVVTEAEIKKDAIEAAKTAEVVTESVKPTINPVMAKYAELAGKHSNFTAK